MAAGFREGLVEGDGLPIRHMDAAEGPARNLCGGHRARYHPRPRATEPQVPGRRLRDAGLRRLGQEHAYARHGRARADDGCRRPSRSAPSRSGTESLETGYKTPVVPSVSSSGSAAAPVIPISSWATGNMPRTNTAWRALVKASSVDLWTSNISAPTMKPLSTACCSSGWTIPMGCFRPLSGQSHHDAGGQAPYRKLGSRRVCRRIGFDGGCGRVVSERLVSDGRL